MSILSPTKSCPLYCPSCLLKVAPVLSLPFSIPNSGKHMLKSSGLEFKVSEQDSTRINPEALATLWGHTAWVLTLTVLPDGRLVSGSHDKTIKVWNLLSGECEATFSGHTDYVRALTVLQDGRLASGSADNTVKIWNLLTGECEATLSGHASYVYALTVLQDGRLASGSHDNTIKVWNTPLTEQCEATLSDHTNHVMALAVLQDGRLASGSGDSTIKLWNPLTWSCERTLWGHTDYVRTLTVLADGRLASGSWDRTVRVWNPLTGTCEAKLLGHTRYVMALTVLAEGRLASGSQDKTIKVWNLLTGRCEATLSGHTSDVNALTGLSDGRLASGSEDKSIKVWDVSCRPVISTRQDTSDPLPLQALPMMMRSNASEEDDYFDRSIPEGKVKLGRELGKGSYGTVYEAKYNFQTVAVKCYEGSRLPERVAREIRHEVSIMLRLEHECLVRFLGLVRIDSHPAMLVMEYGAKGSLYHYLHSEEDIPWGLRLRMAEELARGLAYLHQEKVVHRDIKSLNVVLDRDHHAKWCDFGLAQLKIHSTMTSKRAENTGQLVGTTRWMAPELFDEEPHSRGSDLWALGMVFFELASRRIPFSTAVNDMVVTNMLTRGKVETVPDECKQQYPGFGMLMRSCWAERSKRPTAEEVLTELEVLKSLYSPATEVSTNLEGLNSVSNSAENSDYLNISRSF